MHPHETSSGMGALSRKSPLLYPSARNDTPDTSDTTDTKDTIDTNDTNLFGSPLETGRSFILA